MLIPERARGNFGANGEAKAVAPTLIAPFFSPGSARANSGSKLQCNRIAFIVAFR